MKRISILIAFLWLAASMQAQTIYYVTTTGAGNQNGSSWANASSNLQATINAAVANSQIWVKAGTYKPTTGTDRSISFTMKNNVAIYGGFNGTESALAQRNYSTNVTILSGDLNGDDVINGTASNLTVSNKAEDSWNVINNSFTSGAPLTSSAVLDGFTITGGNSSNFTGSGTSGGGMYNLYASPTLRNIIFRGNSAENGGGGMMNSLNCVANLTNVTFDRNFSQNDGGGMYNYTGANITLSGCTFTGNFCYGNYGGGAIANFQNTISITGCSFIGNFGSEAGAILTESVSGTITNCSFIGDQCFQDGGCMWNENSNISMTNCTFANGYCSIAASSLYDRSSTINLTGCTFFGNTYYNWSPTATVVTDGTNPVTNIVNCIFWGNEALFGGTTPNVSYSDIQGGFAGTGNINADPLFVSTSNLAGNDGIYGTADDGLALQSCSPAINAGNSTGISGTDLAGQTRVYGSAVDMGPYEYQGSPTNGNWYLDADQDGYYTGSLVVRCSSPGPGYRQTGIIGGGDCDDNNSAIFPGATVVCNGHDNSCNSNSNPGLAVTPTIMASGATTFCTGGSVTLTVATGDNALVLNGTSQYMITPDLKSSFPDNSFTAELWFNANAAGVIMTELGTTIINNSWHDAQIEVEPNGDVKVGVWQLAPVTVGNIAFGEWNHVALRYNAATNTLDGFLNGVPSSSTVTGSRQVVSTQYWAFGAYDGTNFGTPDFFNGQIDEIRIWNRAISNTQVAENYNVAVAPNAAGLVAYYKTDETSGTTAYDATSHGNNGTVVNGATWSVPTSRPNSGSIYWSDGETTTSITVSTSGSYSAILTLPGDCGGSSTATTVTVLSPASSTASQTACGSYTWNGVTYTNSGSYSKTFTGGAANGCDSVANLNLTINPLATSNSSQTACSSYTWNGVTYNASGNYSKTFTGGAANGCDSIAYLNLTINQTVSSNTTHTACVSYTWNGVTYNTSGNYSKTFTGGAANGCDSTAHLALTINQPVTSNTTHTACSSYTWNGITYTTGGNYSKTFTGGAANGCDSTANLHLTINQPDSSNTTRTACAAYTWNGSTYNANGNYTKVFAGGAANGCDSVAVLHLTINQPDSSSNTQTACSSYTWNGTTYNTSGTYTRLFTGGNSHGCDSTAILHLTINQPDSSSTTHTACVSYTWNGTTYNASGTYSRLFTGGNSHGCDSTAILHLSIYQPDSSTTAHSACVSYTWNGTTYTASGTYTKLFAGGNSHGCDSTAILQLSIYQPDSSSTNHAACSSYTWNGVTYNTSGTYTKVFTGGNSHGCDSTAVLHLIINQPDSSTTTQTACGSYTWNGTTYTNSGTYNKVFAGGNSHGCDSTAVLHLTIRQLASSSDTQTACSSYTWNGVTYTASGNYSKTVAGGAANGCDSTANLVLTINQPDSSTTNITICPAQLPYSWNGLTFTTAGTQAVTLINSAGCDSTATLVLGVSSLLSSSVSAAVCAGDVYPFAGSNLTQAGVYRDTVVASGGCDSVVILTLTVNSLPVPVITQNNDTLSTQAFASYQWFNNGQSINGANGQTYIINQNGSYSVLVTDTTGCSDTSTVYAVTNLGIKENAAGFIKLYPNPNSGRFVVEVTSTEVSTVSITDATGKVLMQAAAPLRNTTEFNLESFAAGIYFCRVKANDEYKYIRFIILR